MKLPRWVELKIAKAISKPLAAYLRNGATQDLESMRPCSEMLMNQAKNYLEELACQVEQGKLPSWQEPAPVSQAEEGWLWEK
jgi:hypothetical protein